MLGVSALKDHRGMADGRQYRASAQQPRRMAPAEFINRPRQGHDDTEANFSAT